VGLVIGERVLWEKFGGLGEGGDVVLDDEK